MNVSWKPDSFRESIGNSSSRFSRSSETSFGILVRGKVGCVWPRGYHVDGLRMQFFRNCFRASMGLLRFGTNYFTHLEKRRTRAPPLWSPFQIAKNLLREIPLPNSVHAEAVSDFLACFSLRSRTFFRSNT